MKYLLSESELLKLADLNLVRFWCESSRWIPNTEIFEYDDMTFINSGIDSVGCSIVFATALETNEQPHVFLAHARKFFSGRKRAFALMLRGHCDQDVIRYCKETKMFLVSETPGMVLDKSVKEIAVPAGAELHWVYNDEELQDFKNVVREAYIDLAFPEKVTESYFTHARRVLNPHVALALVYLEGEPACTALTILSHGIAGVYWVGTIKQARGRGLAEYCVREVSNNAFNSGARKVVLQASKFGEPIYLKIGYREFTKYSMFICSSE